jgi:hypothetical protein
MFQQTVELSMVLNKNCHLFLIIVSKNLNLQSPYKKVRASFKIEVPLLFCLAVFIISF